MEREVELGQLQDEYRGFQALARKSRDPDLAKELLRDTHVALLRAIERKHDPTYTSDTILDLRAHQEAHPEEWELTPDDLTALETLPLPVREKLRELLHLKTAA